MTGVPHPSTARSAPRVIRNTRHRLDRDTCGQAALATVLAALDAGPFAAREKPDDAAAVDLVRAGFPPDLPFGLGTSAWRIAAGLQASGLAARVTCCGPFGLGARRAWGIVRAHAARGVPVPVCLDDGLIGGTRWGAHWAVVLGGDLEHVALGNAGPHARMPLARFLAAWRCRHLPWPYDCCAVLATR